MAVCVSGVCACLPLHLSVDVSAGLLRGSHFTYLIYVFTLEPTVCEFPRWGADTPLRWQPSGQGTAARVH